MQEKIKIDTGLLIQVKSKIFVIGSKLVKRSSTCANIGRWFNQSTGQPGVRTFCTWFNSVWRRSAIIVGCWLS